MPPGASLWHSLIVRHAKSWKAVLQRASQAVEAQLSTGQPQAKLEAVLVRNTPKQPLHPLARIRQSQSRWYSTARSSLSNATRHFSSSSRHASGPKYDRASFPKSRIGSYINQSSGRAPFASTLRPNLTGGTLGRTAGGYSLGSGRVGGARYFSHGPASQAQVLHNVSQGLRAFLLGGQRAQYDGVSPHSGGKKYRALGPVQDDASRKLRSVHAATPGSTLRYAVNPTLTALTPLAAVAGWSESESAEHLNTTGLLDALSVDFSRALKDLAAVLNDLQRLAALGDLPITAHGSELRVHFPGCDADTVERLCQEMGVQRGVVEQDADFDAFAGTEIALLFPFAPSDDGTSDAASLYDLPISTTKSRHRPSRQVISFDDMLSASDSPAFSTVSDTGLDEEGLHDFEDVLAASPAGRWSPHSAYESVSLRSASAEGLSDEGYADPLEYQGFEGIYRFLEELDAAKR